MPFSFMNTAEEWHSFVIGFYEGATFFVPSHYSSRYATAMIDEEYWYYSFGRGLGFWLAILLAVGIARLVVLLF